MNFLARLSGLMRRKSTVGGSVVTSRDLLHELLGGQDTVAGVAVGTAQAMRYAAVLACVRVIAETVGMLPLHLYRRTERSRDRIDTPLAELLGTTPNDWMTACEFWEMVAASLAVRGRFFAWKNVVRGEVLELLPLNPDAVQARLRDDYTPEFRITFRDGSTRTVGQDEVLYIRLFTLDGFTGLNPIAYARESIGLGIATQQHGARLFANGARPSGVLSTEQNLNKPQRTELRESWEEGYGGDNQMRTAVLSNGLKYQPMTMTSEDAQFLETRKFQRSEIAGIYRVPPHKIGDLERATFSNIEHQSLEFVTDCLQPYVTRIEQRINVSLVPRADRGRVYAKFNLGALLRGDMAGRSQYYQRLQQCGALSPNEIREREDFNPRDGGDVYLTPVNMAIDGKVPGADNPAPGKSGAPRLKVVE